MSLPSSDEMLLVIRCPACSQRFKVGEDLRGKTVECGACETRFKVTDEVIVRRPKVYPGERNESKINSFQRVPLALQLPVGTHTAARYGQAPDPAVMEPVSPLRILAGICGVAGMIAMALLLMLGGGRAGILDGMPIERRLIMGGFTALVGLLLLIYANPKARRRALAVGMIFATAVMVIPFLFRDGSTPIPARDLAKLASTNVRTPKKPAPLEGPQEPEEIVALRATIGTDPLVKEINRLAKEGSTKQAYGIWLRGMVEMNRLLIRDYVFRTTDADPSSANFYPRGDGNFLMVVAGPKQNLQELAEVTSALGKVTNIYPEISVIEVAVTNENFAEGPIEKLTNKNDPAFYNLNKRELESIDLDRVKRAVQRLADAEPSAYRVDITRRLITLLGEDQIDFKEDICIALSRWAEARGPASEAAIIAVESLLAKKQKVAAGIIALIAKEQNLKGIPLVHQLWLESPNSWEGPYADFGQPIEKTLAEGFSKMDGSLRHSAIRLLGKVGSSASLEVLSSALQGASNETKILIENAQAAIRKRLAR